MAIVVMKITYKTHEAWRNRGIAMGANLSVFVEPGCVGCERALHLVEEMGQRFPALEAEALDLSRPEVDRPDYVFAVPTFVLNGRVLSLGNPRRSRLIAAVEAALNERGGMDDQ